MEAVHIKAFGGPECLEMRSFSLSSIGEGEVLIVVKAAGVNRPDIIQRLGKYPAPKGASADIPGLEVAGIIEAVGEGVNDFKVGDKVCALLAGGGYASHAIAPASCCMFIPDGLSMEEAAAIPETVFTVWHNVFHLGKLRAGEHLLVHGGSSGIGVSAIQMALAAGAKVSTTVGSEEKKAFCTSLGAERVILYRKEDFAAVLKDDGVDVILDMVGGDYFEKNIDLLNDDGRLVYINAVNGSKVNLDIWKVMRKRLLITGSTLRNRDLTFKQKLRDEVVAHVWPWIRAGMYKTYIYRTFPLSEAAAAHRLMESSLHMGKIVLTTQ